MINLNNFNEIGAGNRGRLIKHTYIWISGKNCTLNFSHELSKDVAAFFGSRVCVLANDDLTQLVLHRGDGRLIKDNARVSLNLLADDIRAKFGDNIHYLYFNGRWEEAKIGSTTTKVYLLELCAKKYVNDATIRTVKKA